MKYFIFFILTWALVAPIPFENEEIKHQARDENKEKVPAKLRLNDPKVSFGAITQHGANSVVNRPEKGKQHLNLGNVENVQGGPGNQGLNGPTITIGTTTQHGANSNINQSQQGGNVQQENVQGGQEPYKQDSCAAGINMLAAKMNELQADIRAIALSIRFKNEEKFRFPNRDENKEDVPANLRLNDPKVTFGATTQHGANSTVDRPKKGKHLRLGNVENVQGDPAKLRLNDPKVSFGTTTQHGANSVVNRPGKGKQHLNQGTVQVVTGPSYPSCRDIYQDGECQGNTAYRLQTDAGIVPVYCHMTSLGSCGDGGWTLVMKIDGHKSTFHYDSDYWTNKDDYNLLGGETGFDSRETKLPTYWSTPFSKICLAMKIGCQVRSIVINRQANSLYSLIADGQYRQTTLGRETWKSLIGSQASLQKKCEKEGFNVVGRPAYSKARIGILGNNENDCSTSDSRIGFGTGGKPDDSNTCGNEAGWGGDNKDKHIPAMGYILVQ